MNTIILCSIGKKLLTEEIETKPKAPKFKVGDKLGELKLLSTNIFFARVTIKIGQKEKLLLILC